MSFNVSTFDTGIIIRRSLFFIVLVALTLGNLFTLFRGLNSPQAMDQAQIAREISRGNGFSTKFIRPAAYEMAVKTQGGTAGFNMFQDTYHAPLNPLINAAVLKLLGADKADTWQMTKDELVYPLDRVIATVCTLFFLLSIGVTYLLVVRIFDAKIAGVVAILMLFSDTFWNYSLSGLPQMLMMLLFTCGIYFVYRAVETAVEGRPAMTPAIIAGVFFTLLSLTHWMAVWVAFGYIIFATIAFRPRGLVGVILFGVLLLAVVIPISRNITNTGTPFGAAYLTIYNGLGDRSEDLAMRTADLGERSLDLRGIISNVVRTTLLQTTDIIPFLAGIIVAPLFFLALLHPFKRQSIALFRWAILGMWLAAAFGMAIFGISREPLDPNQMHLMFAPIMTAYGLALISILWARLDFVATNTGLRNLHLIVIVMICALPLLLALPSEIRAGFRLSNRGGIPQWPPYFASALNSNDSGLKSMVAETDIVVADQPWAVAWYADRKSLWLPITRDEFNNMENAAADLQTPFTGILISPSSHGSDNITNVTQRYGDFASFVLNGSVFMATYPPGVSIYDKATQMTDIAKRYPYPKPLVGMQMMYYSDRAENASE
ncbi:MAG: hypothetical protein EAZ42_10995 [Verrucomicrobia bacterium]|nr:MAG: hypothetical protein EAZ42_10995 [Verrucomicrobiota bacterium]